MFIVRPLVPVLSLLSLLSLLLPLGCGSSASTDNGLGAAANPAGRAGASGPGRPGGAGASGAAETSPQGAGWGGTSHGATAVSGGKGGIPSAGQKGGQPGCVGRYCSLEPYCDLTCAPGFVSNRNYDSPCFFCGLDPALDACAYTKSGSSCQVLPSGNTTAPVTGVCDSLGKCVTGPAAGAPANPDCASKSCGDPCSCQGANCTAGTWLCNASNECVNLPRDAGLVCPTQGQGECGGIAYVAPSCPTTDSVATTPACIRGGIVNVVGSCQ